MKVSKRLDVQLDQDEYEAFTSGNPIQIPTGNRVIVLLPPPEDSEDLEDSEDSELDDLIEDDIDA